MDWPLHVAAQVGDLGLVELLLAAGAAVNAEDENGHTPLYVAGLAGHRVVCDYLREKGGTADFTQWVSGENCRLRLYDAAVREAAETVRVLHDLEPLMLY